MVVKLNNGMSLEEINKTAERVIKANGSNFQLMQQVTIAAMEHLAQHGNVNVFAKCEKAANSFKGKVLLNKWRAYVLEYTWLTYNKKGLKGKALTDAAFDVVWTKDGTKEMNVDGARGTNWWEYELPNDARETDFVIEETIAALVSRINKRIQSGAIKSNKRMKVDAAYVRSILRDAAESIKDKVEHVETKAAAKPETVKAAKPAKLAKAA